MKFLIPFLFVSLAAASTEKPTPQDFQSLMALDYQSFDQSLPNGGWRGIADRVDAAKTIDAFHLHHFETLLGWQHRILYWHAGQVYASENLYPLAVTRLKKAIDPDETPDNPFKWNAYARATIAFLEKDFNALVIARDELKTGDPQANKPNMVIVEALVRCFEKPYSEAYGSHCR